MSGQRLDDAALSGQKVVQGSRTADRSDDLLRTISVGSLAVFGASLIAVALVRGRWHLGLAVAVVIIGSNVTTQVYKAIVQRPDLLHNDVIPFNTLPSGHCTVAASLAAALVLVVPHRMRALAATLGALYAAGIATMTLAAGLAPSERRGAARSQWSVSGRSARARCSSICGGRVGRGSRRACRDSLIGAIVVLLVGFTVVLATTTIDRADGIHIVRIGVAYLLATLSIVVVGVGFIVSEVLLLRGVSLDVSFRRRAPGCRRADRGPVSAPGLGGLHLVHQAADHEPWREAHRLRHHPIHQSGDRDGVAAHHRLHPELRDLRRSWAACGSRRAVSSSMSAAAWKPDAVGPGQSAVTVTPVPRVSSAQRLGERQHVRLGRVVHGHQRPGLERRGRRDVEHAAVTVRATIDGR